VRLGCRGAGGRACDSDSLCRCRTGDCQQSCCCLLFIFLLVFLSALLCLIFLLFPSFSAASLPPAALSSVASGQSLAEGGMGRSYWMWEATVPHPDPRCFCFHVRHWCSSASLPSAAVHTHKCFGLVMIIRLAENSLKIPKGKRVLPACRQEE